jgi:hypothetical protein
MDIELELNALLKEYNIKEEPEYILSDDTTSDETLSDDIYPDDSISQVNKKLENGIYHIEGNIEIKNGELINVTLNEKENLKKYIKEFNEDYKIYKEIKKELKEKIKNKENEEYKNIKKKHESEIENLKRVYENKYKYQEEDINNKYKNKIEILEEKIKNIKEQTELEYKIRLEYEKKRVEDLEKNNNNLILLTNKKAQNKGIEGEQEIYNHIKNQLLLNENSAIYNVSKDKKENADLYLKHNKLNCVIEIKNHTTTIHKNDIKKFEEVYIKQEKYNCGIFISLESEFAVSSNKQDLDIKFINNKPIIYLSNVNSNKDKIILAIKILEYLLANQDEYNFDKILYLLKAQLTNYSLVNKRLLDINNLVNNIIIETKKYKKEIEDFIYPEGKNVMVAHTHYTKLNETLIQCNYCNQKPYDINKTQNYILKHLKEKHNIILDYITI